MSYKVKTPHAAVLVWNYIDRISAPTGEYNSTGVKNINGTETDPPTIISTLSCVSIQTNKTKGQPEGSFNLVLAPYKNWTSTLTAGSWCVLLMSNEPITEQNLKKASKDHVKMIGRIETVRCETSVGDDGARQTLYYVSGIDWGHVFNSILYIDNLIASQRPGDQRNDVAVALRNALFGDKGSPESFLVHKNLSSILNVMGQNLAGYTKVEGDVGRLAKTIYEFQIPESLSRYFKFRDARGNEIKAKTLNKLIALVAGYLTKYDEYLPSNEAVGFIDPFSLQGTHSLWQVLLENSNPVLNEMFTDMRWHSDDSVQLTLYNRIRPFSFKDLKLRAGKSGTIKSYFQNVKTHTIDPIDVISLNAGTNWRDKFNFIEIKPQFQEFAIVANWYKQKAQVFDRVSFEREGFRPLIFDTKQFPSGNLKSGLSSNVDIDWDQLEVWAQLLRDWYFNTHRMLNGTLTMQGSTEYIGVGNNIKFDAGLLNPTPNIKAETRRKGKHDFILAHVESVSHSFTITPDGARTYRTVIQFVRGIIVDENGRPVDQGLLDQDASKLSYADDTNSNNVISTSDNSDPDPQKVRGR